jgi:hypothetical protein
VQVVGNVPPRRKGGGGEVKKLKGPFDGSRAMVRKILGAKVRGDKEEGHSSTGDHDPSQPNAYAQDIGSAGADPAENEPPYSQKTLNRMVKNLRKLGGDVPSLTLGQDNWEGMVNGYYVHVLTIEHGTGPHIHAGARWTGESTGVGYAEEGGEEGGGSVSNTYSAGDVEAYAEATGRPREQVLQDVKKGRLTGLQILRKLREIRSYGTVGAAAESAPVEQGEVLARVESELAR